MHALVLLAAGGCCECRRWRSAAVDDELRQAHARHVRAASAPESIPGPVCVAERELAAVEAGAPLAA